MHDARRNDAQRQLPVADDDGMSRIVSAAKARDDVVIGCIKVDDPALALVTPLHPNDYVGFRCHFIPARPPAPLP